MLKRIRELLSRRSRKSGASGSPRPDPAARPADAAPAPRSPAVHHGPRAVHRPIPHSDLDPDAVKIVQRLTRFDHTAYLVGGCVRDLLLDRKPKDFDIATSATPRQIKRVFRNCRIIGRRFRLAHIYFQNGKIIEVATFRARDGQDEPPTEANTEAHADLLIRDDNVFGTAEEDALRRDFTINALFYDINSEAVLDHAEGLEDLRRRLIRTIGDPAIRFREDPVRCLRAVKFAARLGFALEPLTLDALRRTRSDLKKSAPPRILEELNRFGREGAARPTFDMLRDTGLLEEILPEIAASASGAAWELLGELLDHLDSTRSKDGRDVRTGEILAVLLLPGLAARTGRTDVQSWLDGPLRSIGQRLRVPRREMEHCRLVLAALTRMIQGGRVEHAARRGGNPRDGVPDAQWMFGVISRRRGAGSTAAFEALQAASLQPLAAKAAGSSPEDAPGTGSPTGRRRRRSRRGGRGRRGGAVERPTPPARGDAGEQPRARDLPPVWDDNYFFAALPSAPDDAPDGAVVGVGSAATDVQAGTEVEIAASSEPQPGGRRRRRGRRRGRRGGAPRPGEAVAANVETALAEPSTGESGEEDEP